MEYPVALRAFRPRRVVVARCASACALSFAPGFFVSRPLAGLHFYHPSGVSPAPPPPTLRFRVPKFPPEAAAHKGSPEGESAPLSGGCSENRSALVGDEVLDEDLVWIEDDHVSEKRDLSESGI